MTNVILLSRTTIIDLIQRRPGISDREIAEAIHGPDASSLLVKDICRELSVRGQTKRRLRSDGLLGNFVVVHPSGVAAQ